MTEEPVWTSFQWTIVIELFVIGIMLIWIGVTLGMVHKTGKTLLHWVHSIQNIQNEMLKLANNWIKKKERGW